jgi:DNA-binding winged helix-turn-helix (wHTH) protein
MAETPEFGDRVAGSILRFGPFELDLRAAELRKKGIRIRLQEQPFQILRILLERQGQVVLREEIQKKLWPNNTVVEFDHGINAAVRRLRDALQDSAGKPRYIETVARRGYRFIGGVEPAVQPELASDPTIASPGNGLPCGPSVSLPANPVKRRPRSRILTVVVVVTALAGVWVGAEYYKRVGRPFQPRLQPLVRLDVDLGSEVSPGPHRGADAILSPDGTRVVYISRSKLFDRQLDQASTTDLPGTETQKRLSSHQTDSGLLSSRMES